LDRYVEFLDDLFARIAEGRPPDAAFWKADTSICFGG
jgi:hypothetical protein